MQGRRKAMHADRDNSLKSVKRQSSSRSQCWSACACACAWSTGSVRFFDSPKCWHLEHGHGHYSHKAVFTGHNTQVTQDGDKKRRGRPRCVLNQRGMCREAQRLAKTGPRSQQHRSQKPLRFFVPRHSGMRSRFTLSPAARRTRFHTRSRTAPPPPGCAAAARASAPGGARQTSGRR